MIISYDDDFFDCLCSFITEFDVSYLKSKNPYLVNFVYLHDNIPVGLISYSIIYDRVELEYLWVKVDFRNKGIASLLLDYMFETPNVINFTLEVCVDNIGAIKLYKKNGFKVASIRKNYYGSKDAYLMIREMI